MPLTLPVEKTAAAESAAVVELVELPALLPPPPPPPSLKAGTAPGAVNISGVDEPPPKRPKLQFGKGLASRMSSAAQSELMLPETAVSAVEGSLLDVQPQQQHQTQLPETHSSTQTQAESEPKGHTQAREGPQYPAGTPERAQAEQLKIESESPAVVVMTLEDLLAQNSPEMLSKLSWVQLHKDLQSLNSHKTRLQVCSSLFV